MITAFKIKCIIIIIVDETPRKLISESYSKIGVFKIILFITNL